jgi:hypothetical protein
MGSVVLDEVTLLAAIATGSAEYNFKGREVAIKVTIEFSVGSDAGGVILEEAVTSGFAGTWAQLANVPWVAANRVHTVQINQVLRILRARISPNIGNGTVTVKLSGGLDSTGGGGVAIDGFPLGIRSLQDWLSRLLTGANAPVVEVRGYDSVNNAIRVISGSPAIAHLYKTSNRVNAGDIITWVPANTLRTRIMQYSMSGTAAGLVAYRENTGSIGAPVWTSRYEHRLGGDGPGVINAQPEPIVGPAGDGVGATAKLEVLSGTGTFYGTMLGYEST